MAIAKELNNPVKCLLCGTWYVLYCEHCDRPCKKKWCGTCKNIESAQKSARKGKP